MIPKFSIPKIQNRLKKDRGSSGPLFTRRALRPIPFSSSPSSPKKQSPEPASYSYYGIDPSIFQWMEVDDYNIYIEEAFELWLLSTKNRYIHDYAEATQHFPPEFSWDPSVEHYRQQVLQKIFLSAFMHDYNNPHYPFLREKNGAPVLYEDAMNLAKDMWGIKSPGDTPWNQNIVIENEYFYLRDDEVAEGDYHNNLFPYLIRY